MPQGLSVSDVYGYPAGSSRAATKTAPAARNGGGSATPGAVDRKPGFAVLAMFIALVLFKVVFE